jgi:hypothetical protein
MNLVGSLDRATVPGKCLMWECMCLHRFCEESGDMPRLHLEVHCCEVVVPVEGR